MRPRSLFEDPTAAARSLMTQETARSLANRVLGMAKADSTRLVISSDWSGNSRFAGGEITTSGEISDNTVTVISTVGKRRASSSTNILDDAAMRRTVDLSERLARLSPEDPEIMPELGTQTYQPVNGYIERTADLGPEARAAAVTEVLQSAATVGKPAGEVFVAGFLEANA
ncbi:MAG: TldD/PmbA family protein, partial [Gemmatimonadota bacterium]|nr:TldD/PmbA family protein [Gemmatimonadota bacterium]